VSERVEMVTPATRQDLDFAMNKVKDTVIKNSLTRNDMQSIVVQVRSGIVRDLQSLHSGNQQSIRQSVDGRAQISQRISNLESSMSRIEHLLSDMVNNQAKTNHYHGQSSADSGYLFQRI
jgi:hypothetical protein